MWLALPLASGLLALTSTTAVVGINIALAANVSPTSIVRGISIGSTLLELVALIILTWLCLATIWPSLLRIIRSAPMRPWIPFTIGSGTCLIAAGVTAGNIARLAFEIGATHDGVVGSIDQGLLLGSAAAFGVAIACQLIFLIANYVHSRQTCAEEVDSLHTNDDIRPSPKSNVKSVAYSQTRESLNQTREMESMDSSSFRFLHGRNSSVQTLNTQRRSTSQSVRPGSSKSRLNEKSRKPSLETFRSSLEVTTDGWDISWAAEHTLEPVQEVEYFPYSRPPFSDSPPMSPSPPLRNFSPSPSVDLEPPSLAYRRDRAHSIASIQSQQSITSTTSQDEAHIHPLFRSDSPTPPPPIATPGTSVVAAPDAGRVLKQRPSQQSLRRMRSGSLPTTPSPLSRQTSLEAVGLKRIIDGQRSIKEVEEEEDASRAGTRMASTVNE